jgi:putative ABC transport system ATP-binding protein
MVDIEGLSFQYGEDGFRLWVPRLSIRRGERVAIVGPSGSGKTTLLFLLAGVHVPQAGSIRVGDVELGRLSDAARRDFRIRQVGFVFQDFQLLDYLNVLENILLPCLINRRVRWDSTIRRTAESLASSLGLGGQLQRPLGCLSHGERQRVAICRALLLGPRLLLADEPTGNLDPDNKRRILRILLERAQQTQATLLVVTHDHSLLSDFDRVLDCADFQARTGEG